MKQNEKLLISEIVFLFTENNKVKVNAQHGDKKKKKKKSDIRSLSARSEERHAVS